MTEDVTVLKDVFAREGMVYRLKELLLENRADWPLTDLYLLNPVLKSRECTADFRRFVLDFINSKSGHEICEFVNSAVSTILTYVLAGGEKNSNLVHDTTKWIKQQRLLDGGWHWKPVELLPAYVLSEAWISAGVLATLRIADEVDKSYMSSILEFLKRDWEIRKWGENPEVALVYLGAAGLNKNNPMVEEAVELLRTNQLSSGAWSGYSKKTRRGGIFRTCVTLNALTAVGLGLEDASIVKGLEFTRSKLDRIVNAKWGGVIIQGFYSLTSALLQIGLID
jgi:hypothetical protein